MEHVDDTSLDGDYAVGTFTIPNPTNRKYRVFRVVQTGKNKFAVKVADACFN